MAQINAGEAIIRILEHHGVDRIFCVPGESFLPVLDALQDSSIETVLARQEGGAAMMAEADGKMTGNIGVAMVTRGPGATNASCGVHVAQQDSTPMLLLVGQVAREMKGRDAFQEVDFEQFYGNMAKYVHEINQAEDIPKVITKALSIAMEGRPGPVVISMPEDMLYDSVSNFNIPDLALSESLPNSNALNSLSKMLGEAVSPVIIAGGPLWSDDEIALLEQVSMAYDTPVLCSFRRHALMNNTNLCYGGDLGIGSNPEVLSRIKNSDLVILLGGRLSEIPSQSYTLITIPAPQMPFVHIHRDANEIGRVYTPSLGIVSKPAPVLEGLLARNKTKRPPTRLTEAHQAYLAWSDAVVSPPGEVNMAEIMCYLRKTLPDDTIITNGAGNYASWIHRFYRFRAPRTQIAPTSGSMGYGIPAGVAAALRFPDRPVITFAGDGCFQMTLQEMATAKQYGAKLIIIVVDNGIYGTIRMHQENIFPGRVKHTSLLNPDFVALAESMGWVGQKVVKTEEFSDAFTFCRSSDSPALIHVVIDPEAISPSKTLKQIREAAEQSRT